MAELLLRGAQTLGELRGRAGRMEPIADMAVLKPIVDGLVKRGLMIELTAPGRGQVVSHNLYGEQELTDLRARNGGHVASAASLHEGGPAPAALQARRSDDVSARLEDQIAELRADVARLSERMAELESKLSRGSD
jgi:hypothetical protein